ncbi:MAG: cyclic nucleotide-binding domain-containing protein [Usitatibacter sp.]
MSDPVVVAAMKASKLAPELTEGQLATLADIAALRNLGAGEVLVPEGTSDNHLYVLVSGALAIVRGAGTAEPVTLFTLAPGDFVGEMSFIDATPHYASVVAVGSTRVVGLEREKLESLLPSDPEIVYRVMRAIIRAVHVIQRRLSMQSVELTNYIYKQHGRY